MNFLNPSILFALLAVSIPILIHLLNLRKVRKIEFSTLMFLKEIQKSKMRRIRLKQILLLLLRICVIAFLVLSFAKPVYEGYAGDSSSRNNSTTLIFIDDSFSMSARDNRGQYLSQAKDAVKKIMNEHRESDDIYFIPTSQIAMKGKLFYTDFGSVIDSLEKLKITGKTASIGEIMNCAGAILQESKNPVKEIFIISDFQNNNFDEGKHTAQFVPNLDANSVNTYLVKIGEREVNNLSLDSFKVVSRILEKDKDIKIRIYLNNHSGNNAVNKMINLYIGNELRGEKAVDVTANEKKEVDFIFKSSKTGNINGMVEIAQGEFQDDELVQDNKYYFSIYIPNKFNIGLYSENSSDSYFIKLALQSAADILFDSLNRKSELFDVTDVTTISQSISRYNVLFISNKRSFTDNEAIILKDYVSSGGGVFFFLGNSIEINNYNQVLFNKLGSIRIEGINNNSQANTNLKLDKIDFENPVLSDVFVNQQLNITSEKFNIESPKISSYYELLIDDNTHPIIAFSNGKPFLAERKISSGRILVSSVPASNDMSDLPLKTIFVPLLVRSIYYLSGDFTFQEGFFIGSSNLISTKEVRNAAGLQLPDKSNVKLGIDLTSSYQNYLLLPYSDVTSEAGNYIITDSSGNHFSFSLNNNPKESYTAIMNKENLSEFFKENYTGNVIIIEDSDEITNVLKQSRHGIGLWKYFLIAGILFLCAELLLSKKLENS